MRTVNVNPVTGRMDGGFTSIAGEEAVIQAVVQHLRVRYAEWFLRINYGVPYLEEIIGHDNQQILVEIIRQTVLEVPETVAVHNITTHFDRQTRTLFLDFDLVTVYATGVRSVAVVIDETILQVEV